MGIIFTNEPKQQTGLMSYSTMIGNTPALVAQRKALNGGHWALIVPFEAAEAVLQYQQTLAREA